MATAGAGARESRAEAERKRSAALAGQRPTLTVALDAV